MAITTWAQFNAAPNTHKVYLVEMTAIQASVPATTKTLYMATDAKAFTNFYNPTVVGVPRLHRSMSEVFQGTSTRSWGDITILREDGYYLTADDTVKIDDLLDGTFLIRNQAVVIKFGGEDLPYSEYQTIFTGKSNRIVSWNNKQITIRVIDNQEILAEKVVTPTVVDSTTYPNAPAASVGLTIPLALGECDNVKPILVDTTTDKYIATDDAVVGYNSITAVYQDGATWAGGFTDNGDGTFTLTAGPATGLITCDIQGAKFGAGPTYKTKIADIAQGLLEEFGGFATADIDATFISDCNTDIPYTVGLFVEKSQSIMDTLDQLISGLPMWYTFTRAGKFRIGEFKVQSGTPDHTITEKEIDRDSLQGQTEEKVVWRQLINYDRNYTPIDEASAAAALTITQKAKLAQEWQTDEYSDSAIKTKFPLASEDGPFDTVLTAKADAIAVATKWVALLGAFRTRYTFVIKTLSLDYELSDVVSLTYDFLDFYGNTNHRFNLNDTRFRLYDIEEDYIQNSVKLEVWG